MADDYKPGAPSVWDILNKLKGAGNELPSAAQNPLMGSKGGVPIPKVIGGGPKLPWSAPQVKLMGGYNAPKERQPLSFNTEDVIKMLKDEGAAVVGNYKAGQGTNYVFYNAPGNEDMNNWKNNFSIRIPDPSNFHPGSPYSKEGGITKGGMPQNELTKFIDTTGFGKTKDVLYNASGEPYSNPDVLRDAVRWRLGNQLVAPGKEPRSLREKQPTPDVVTTQQPDPNQLTMINQLLAEQQKPQSIVGGNPQNYFSANQLSQRQNLNSPGDFSRVDPYLMGSPANSQGSLSPDVESHIQALRQMLFYGKMPNGQEE